MKSKILILFIVFFLVDNQSNAQEKWKLTDCISYALANNLEVKRYEVAEKIAVENARQSKRNLLPRISAESGAGMNYGRSVDPNTNDIVTNSFFNNTYSIGANIDVFKGFLNQNQIKYQKHRLKSAELDTQKNKDDLAFLVMTDYFYVIYYEGLSKIADEQIEASKLSLRQTEMMVESGLKAKADLLEMAANLEKERLFKIQTDNKLKDARLTLKQKMNFPVLEELNLEENNLPHISPIKVKIKASELYGQFSKWSPQILSSVSDYEAYKNNLALAKSYYYPSVYVSAGYNTGYYETYADDNGKTISFNSQIKNNRSQYVGASLNIPIFSRGQIRSDVLKAKLAVEEAQTRLKLNEQQLYFDIANNVNELEASEAEYIQSQKQLDADQLAFKAADKKYTQGLISVVDFFTIKNRLGNTQVQALMSRLQWETNNRMLDFYKGQRFWENNNLKNE